MKFTKNDLIESFSGINDFSSAQKTFSPFYSNIGIETNPDKDGSGALYFHYNRSSRVTWNSFISFPLRQNKELSTAWQIVFGESQQVAGITFADTDTVYFSSKGLSQIELLKDADENLASCWTDGISETGTEIYGYSKNTDDRDPDETVPFYIYVRVLCGRLKKRGKEIYINADEDNKIIFSAAFEILNIEKATAKCKASYAPESFTDAAEKCRNFYLQCFEDFTLEAGSEEEKKLAAKAAYGLCANLARAPGKLNKYISSFPSRGSYPTHFLWDTCFQNLAYEELSLPLAKQFLMQIAEFQRSDGKFPQFMCSTWERPHYSQPALAGWATMRIAEKEKDEEFLRKMLIAIERNNMWWLNSRGSECGLISCPHGLETGQDDSPRFDNGTTFACDMNSYVLHQLNCAAKLNRILGDEQRALMWDKKADTLSSKIIEILWCEEDSVFYDVSPDSGEFVRIVSPVSFLPLWAGVKLPKEKADKSIKNYLLNEEYLFGKVPFPSVSYNDRNYGSDKWWRGPTWMPNAYLMLETLMKYGYTKEYREAAERLYNVLKADGGMHELFDSKSGRGLGAAEQGWTNAIFIKLCKIINEG